MSEGEASAEKPQETQAAAAAAEASGESSKTEIFWRNRSESQTAADGPGDVVVIAVDGSKQAEQAFDFYVQNLHKRQNTVVLVHSLEMGSSMPTRDAFDSQMSGGVKKRRELQEKYEKKFKDAKIQGKFISDFEKPGDFIVNTASREKADYVVMGTRGQGKMRRTIMGSVSDFVVHHAHCPVIVCRN